MAASERVVAPHFHRLACLLLGLLSAPALADTTAWEFFNPLDPYRPNPSYHWNSGIPPAGCPYESVNRLLSRFYYEWLPGGFETLENAVAAMTGVIGTCAVENWSYGSVSCVSWYEQAATQPEPPLPDGYPPKNRTSYYVRTLPDGMLNFTGDSMRVDYTRHSRCSNGSYWTGTYYGQVIRQYALDPCPVKPLTPLPEGDACAKSLDEGRGQDINGACAAYRLTPEMESAAVCLANKITSVGVPYSGSTATIRNPAYQNHWAEIWRKWMQLTGNTLTPAEKAACANRKITIKAALDQHGITSKPPAYSPTDSHVTGNAIDVSRTTVKQVLDKILADSRWLDLPCYTDVYGLTDYVRSSAWNPPACPLSSGTKWLGEWYDPVHFQYQPLNVGASCP
jgi:hypothetical protein